MQPSSEGEADSDLARYQQRFAAYVRSPADARLPKGLAPDRMRIYRELMLNNASGFLHTCFPVLRQCLGARRWNALVRRFFAQHRCTTPYFREIPAEFVGWLFDESRQRVANEPPYAPYLAHYEWLELAVDTHPDEPAPPPVKAWSNDPRDTPVLNLSLRLACYPYAVQRVGPNNASAPHPMQTTWLMVWRNAEDRVRFGEINAASFELLRALQAKPQTPARLVEALNAAPGQAAIRVEHVLPLIADLATMGVVLGARLD